MALPTKTTMLLGNFAKNAQPFIHVAGKSGITLALGNFAKNAQPFFGTDDGVAPPAPSSTQFLTIMGCGT